MQQPMTGEKDEQAGRLDIVRNLTNLVRSSYFKTFLTILKLLLGLGLFFLAVRGIRWGDLMSGIKSADLVWLVLAIFSVLFGLSLKLWRWAIFIKNYQIKAGFGRIFRAYFVGQAANIILPLRGGELIRIGYFTDQPQNLPAVATTIVLEKYMDLVALTISGILISLKFSVDNLLNLRSLLIPLIVILTLFLVLVVSSGPQVWRKIRANRRVPDRLRVWVDRLVEVSQWLKKPKQVMPGICLTALIWVMMWSTNLILFRSLGLSLGGIAAGLVLTLVYVGLFPALMPGNIGPFYFFASLALLPFGITHEPAVTFAIILHALVTLPPLLGGAVGIAIHSPRNTSL
jgi:uncharacterized protein (TIRG00374 family)